MRKVGAEDCGFTLECRLLPGPAPARGRAWLPRSFGRRLRAGSAGNVAQVWSGVDEAGGLV